jgi:hypothetical protein
MFEESEIQGQRLLDNLSANAVGKLKLDQLLDEPARMIEPGVEQKKSQFEDQVDKNPPDHFRVRTSLDRGHDSVHNELPYPGLGRRQERATQGEKTQDYGGPAVGLPHELDSLGSVGERAMEFLPPL